MDIKDLTQAMHELVESKGWYSPNSSRPQTPQNLAISLSIESNEVLEHFQWGGNIFKRSELGEELADVALYLLQLASQCEIDLEDAILQKIKKNYNRNWD